MVKLDFQNQDLTMKISIFENRLKHYLWYTELLLYATHDIVPFTYIISFNPQKSYETRTFFFAIL